jgi:hypothetical protein
MNDDDKRKLMLTRIETMRAELTDRVGFDAYETFDFNSMSLSDLETVRKAIHETLYAPPPRNRT